jgi:transcriptional regulator with XRE-family HTH domain
LPKSAFSPRYDRLRALLIEARRARDLTQAQVAQRLRKPQSFVSKFERGERRLDVVEFLDVAQVLRVDACEILRKLRT